MKRVEVLLSCMHQTDFSIGFKSNVQSDLLIINQCDKDDYCEMEVEGHLWRMISTKERGLSRSRNMALRNSKGDLLILSDDDECFSPNYTSEVRNAFNQLPLASVIAFNVNRINVPMKKNYYHITTMKLADNFRAFGSPMIAFRRESILNNNIFFNEEFGSGSLWGPGEESIFLSVVRNKKLLVYEHPYVLTTIDYSNTSKWFFGFDERFFYNQGAFIGFSKINIFRRSLYYIYISFYKLRKEKKLPSYKKIVWIKRGRKGWIKQVPYDLYAENGFKYKKDD